MITLLLSENDGPLSLNKGLLLLFQLSWQQDFGVGGPRDFGQVGWGFLGYCAFVFSLSCGISSVVSHLSEGRDGGLWGGGVDLCLGSWLWDGISRGPFGTLVSVMALSFFSFHFRALSFELGLSVLTGVYL